MWAYIIRRIIYNIPVYFAIILFVMLALRVNDPVYAYLGKNATEENKENLREQMGLNEPFYYQFASVFDPTNDSWDQPGVSVGRRLAIAIPPSLSLTLPALFLTTLISTFVGIVSASYRGQPIDRILVVLAVLGMSVSFLVYIILGQYFIAYRLNQAIPGELFAIDGYRPNPRDWFYYCMLPVLISVIVAMGYDTRFYRAVMVEESGRDYMTTAKAKGASKPKIMYVHMLKNAMIPIISRVMTTLPFLITGSILLETYFSIPGMGQTLIEAVNAKDFPVIQGFTAVFAALYILSNILTDVMYALVDPRIRLT